MARIHARHILAALCGLCLGLLVAVGALTYRLLQAQGLGTARPEVHAQAVAEAAQQLIAEVPGIHDSHLDPEVGRVMQAGVDGKEIAGFKIRTNSFGMRDAEFEPGPTPNHLRIVMLGDSYVFGWGVGEEERLGQVLADILATAGRTDVEVLHVGIVSWNIRAEAAYLRRSLRAFSPDIVVHVAVQNDLNDCAGVRGIGAAGRFTPHYRQRTNAVTTAWISPVDWHLTKSIRNHLLDGLDFESKDRYAQATRSIQALQAAIAESGGKYLLVPWWGNRMGVFWEHVAKEVGEDSVVPIPRRFGQDRSFWISPTDDHWNVAGHAYMGRLVAGALTERGFIDLPTPLEDEEVERIRRECAAEREWAATKAPKRVEWGPPVTSSLDFTETSIELATHVYAGISRRGRAAPYAAMILERAGPDLVIRAHGLPRAALPVVHVNVVVNEQPIGRLRIPRGEEVEATLPLPPTIDDEFVTVYLHADDYVYAQDPFARCVAYRLISIESR